MTRHIKYEREACFAVGTQSTIWKNSFGRIVWHRLPRARSLLRPAPAGSILQTRWMHERWQRHTISR